MNSSINYEKILVKAKGKPKEIDHLFQINEMNHHFLNEEMKWLHSLIEMRCQELFLEDDTELNIILKIPEPPKSDDESPYSAILNTHQLTAIDRVILALGIASAHYPSCLKNICTNRGNQ